VAPELAPLPFVTYQAVGGEATNFMDTATLPSQSNARIQINTWATTRAGATALAASVEATLRSSPTLRATVLGAAQATVDADLKLRGTLQDFSIWYA